MHLTPELFTDLQVPLFFVSASYAIPAPRRVLEVKGHTAMLAFTSEAEEHLSGSKLEAELDEDNDWTARLELDDGESWQFVLSATDLSVDVELLRPSARTIALLEGFLAHGLTELSRSVVTGLHFRFHDAWNLASGQGGWGFLNERILTKGDNSVFSSFAASQGDRSRVDVQVGYPVSAELDGLLTVAVPGAPNPDIVLTSLQVTRRLDQKRVSGDRAQLRALLTSAFDARRGQYAQFVAQVLSGYDVSIQDPT